MRFRPLRLATLAQGKLLFAVAVIVWVVQFANQPAAQSPIPGLPERLGGVPPGLPERLSGVPPRVTPPPESFFQLVNEPDRDVARKFYAKYIDVRGMPVAAAAVVDDAALQRTYTIVTSMLAGRPDIIQALVKNRMYLIVIGKDQVYTDMPEYRNSPNPAYQNERVRGTGGRPTSFGEENLLTLPIDRYDDESIGVHEFCHTVDGALRSIDSTWTARRNAAHQNARDNSRAPRSGAQGREVARDVGDERPG